MKRKNKVIIIGICISVIILVIFIAVSLFSTISKIGDRIGNHKRTEQERKDTYSSIIEELTHKKLIPNDWKYVSETYGWGMESANYSDTYYIYIDKMNYEKYKHYWLEGVDKTKYIDEYNKNLGKNGDYVFHAININSLLYTSDTDYENIHMSKNETYYLVQFYNNAIYYKYIYDYRDENNYGIEDNYVLDDDSVSDEYIFHFEKDQLIMEKLIRK